MKELKYCCDPFKNACDLPKSLHPNIRIIKLTKSYHFNKNQDVHLKFNGGPWQLCKMPPLPKRYRKNSLRFFITEGYENYTIDTVALLIEYCPFCGKSLYKFYKDDAYAHEIEGITYSSPGS